MIIVHPSSTCDVCLDPYAWDEDSNLKAPYGIPCGHIYCFSCLGNIQNEICPLCRKRFHRETIKKLHMDPPPNNDENAMIQKLLIAWDDEVEVVTVLEEVERWLDRTQSAPLTQLKKVQADLQKLKTRKTDDKFKIRSLQASYTHLQRSSEQDRNMGRAIEASFATTIEELENSLSQAQTENQSLRNQLARLEFNSPRKDKGKGKARANNDTSDNDPLRHNPLPAPPLTIPMERYATLAGDVRSSSDEAEQIAVAIEASIHDRGRGRDGYSSDVGPSWPPLWAAGPSRLQDPNGRAASGLAGAAQSSSISQGSQIIGYSQHYVEPDSSQAHTPAPTSRPRRSSRPEALPVGLDAAVSQAQQHALRSSPSRRNRIVPGATDEDKLYVPRNVNEWPKNGSQTTSVNDYASGSLPPGSTSAPVDDSHRRHRRHKSKSGHRRREERRREEIAGVTGLGLLDESFEERQNNDISGYVEGPSNGFEYGTTRGAPVSAPAPRARFNATPQSVVPPPPVLSHATPQPRPESSRRRTTQDIPIDGLADRLHSLMEDPSRPRAADDRTSTVSETPTWGTVTSDSSRRQSNTSDVMGNLRSFPAHGYQPSRSSISNEIPVGDPRAFLPAVPPAESSRSRADARNEFFGAAVDPSSTVLSSQASSNSQPSSFAIYNSENPRSARRGNDHELNQSTGTVVNHRLTSQPANISNTTRDTDRHTRHNRPQPLRMESMPHPSSTTTGFHTTYPNHNPLPKLPHFDHAPSSQGTAPPRPVLQEINSAPAIPNVPTPRNLSHNNNDVNALGLELESEGDQRRGYEAIPAFAAPTPRASHGLFLRSFSYDGNEADSLYR